MDIISILQLLGGIGLFLFGMSQMSSSLEKLTGSGLERILETVTTSKKKGVGTIKGWAFGMGVTGIIQSSAATTIMLVGFVNAGIMKVAQAMPVVFGSNVGSTVTAQILRLGDIGDDNLILQLLKPASFAPMLVGIGAFVILFTKNKNAKNIAGILVGLGMLFYGMTLMEGVFAPLKESEKFQSLFTSFENPLLGILIGLVITVILQSSNASVGILQALSATGSISNAVAIPIIIGCNLGKCSTTVIGGIGANRKAKRLIIGYLFFNIFGALFFTVILYILNATVGLPFLTNTVNRSNIATLHLLFNLLTSLILLPFSKQVSEFTEKVVGGDEERPEDIELSKLDDMLLNTPTIALEQCKSLIHKMSEAIMENYELATSMIYEYDETKLPRMEENESFIDKCETVLSTYIVRIDRKRLTPDDKLTAYEILNSIGDFERMGDYCMNIAYVARDKNEQDIHFSPVGHKEVEDIIAAVKYTLETTFKAFTTDDVNLAVRVDPLSETIDELKEIIKSHHVERLQEGICSIAGGVSLFDLVNSFERIASHAANVSLHVIKKVRRDDEFDEMHGHANDSHSEEYKALYRYYESQYIDPILRENVEDLIQQAEAEKAAREAAEATKKSKESEKKSDLKSKLDAKTKEKSGKTKTEKKSDGKSDSKSDKKLDAKSDSKSDKKSDAKSDSKSDKKSDGKSDKKQDKKDGKDDKKSDNNKK
ncbi:phosphate:Na+ symporter [Lachnospiraceae bacterium NE2001]|nr:phosphate:Na+ symporter [Lachnospiraceae bacterium NE2001]